MDKDNDIDRVLKDWWSATDRVVDHTWRSAVEFMDGHPMMPFAGGWNSHRFGRRDHLWAYPVPSARQYDRCLELNGSSGWTKDGVWKCVLPDSVDETRRRQLFKGSDSDASEVAFKDYSAFLDWRRQMRLAEAKAVAETKLEPFKLESDAFDSKALAAKDTKYVTEDEAKRLGKKVISSSYTYESSTKDDGATEVRKVSRKWYDDGTSSVKETATTSGEGYGSGSSGSGSGWFWR